MKRNESSIIKELPRRKTCNLKIPLFFRNEKRGES
jgi:hypothetical protein